MQGILYSFQNIWFFSKAEEIDRLIHLFKDIYSEKDSLRVLNLLLLYLYSHSKIKPEEVKRVSDSIAPELGDMVMTTAQVLIKKGKIEKS